MMKSSLCTYGAMASGSSTAPRFDRHRQDFRSPTALNTAFMAMFLMNRGITFSTGDFSLATLAANLERRVWVLFSRPIRWCTAAQISEKV